MKSKLEIKLESMIESLHDMQELLNRSKSNNESIESTIFNKKIEDGILSNIQNANNKQLRFMIDNFRFKYYTEFNTDKDLLRVKITSALREDKLNKIL